MAVKRHDLLGRAPAPELGKAETSYPTPNKADRLVIERVPIKASHYVPLAYGSPHEDYDNNGLFLVWQGKVKAENNQVAVIRVYANDTVANEDWFNATIKYGGDVRTFPVYGRTYIKLRSTYDPTLQGSALKDLIRLRVLTPGTYTSKPTVTVTPAGFGSVAPTAEAIMNPNKTKVIGFEILTAGSGMTSASVGFSGGGGSPHATASAKIQESGAVLVHEETSRLESEDQQMASLFIKVRQIYESLPGPLQVWDTYTDERGAVQRTSQSVLSTDVTGAGAGTEAATFFRAAGIVTKTWFEPRGDSAIVLTKFVETWTEVIINDKRVTSEFGGAIISHGETTDEPGAQSVAGGYLVVSDRLETKSPHEQTRIREAFDPASAVPSLELLIKGDGYGPTAPALSFTGGTGAGGAVGHTVLGFPVQSVAVSVAGSDFEAPPSVHFLNGGGGGGLGIGILGYGVFARVTAPGNNFNTITGVPTVTFGPPPSGITATGTAIIGYGVYFCSITDPGGVAKGTLTSDGTNVTNLDTVSIDGKTYTFKTAAPTVEGDVQRGGSADASLLNLIRAINHSGTPGTDYSCAAAHERVSAAASVTAHAFQISARAPGVWGNALATTEVSTHLSWGAATLLGGFAYTEIPIALIEGDGFDAGAFTIMGSPVSEITIGARGTGFTSPPDITVMFGSGYGLLADAVLGYSLASITLDTTGSGFTGIPTITIDPPDTGGTQATASPIMGYGIGEFQVTVPGSTYTSAPGVDLSNGDGSGASGTAFLGYVVASTTINDMGSGYVTFPTMGVGSGSPTTAATFSLRVGVDTATIVTSGVGYVVNDILTITGGTFTTAGQLRVTTVGGGGEITGVSIETVGVYSAISSNPRGVTGGSGGSGSSPVTETRTYVSDGDQNGVFYREGTNFGASAWTNPHTAGRCTFLRSSTVVGVDSDFCNQATDYNTTNNSHAVEWIAVDVGSGRSVIVSDYLIQNGAQDGLNAPKNWTLQGTNTVSSFDFSGVGSATWTDIDIRTNDTTIAQTVGSWGHFILGSTPAAYRYFRFLQTDVNQAGLDYFQVSEIELYGDFSYTATIPAPTFTVKYKIVQANVLTGGVDYESAPNLTPSAPGGGGTTADIDANLAATGRLKRITAGAAGGGYTVGFAVIFTGGGGSGAAATAILNSTADSLAGVQLDEPGDGYLVQPGVTVTGGGGSGATAHSTLTATGVLWKATVRIGGVYETPVPTLLISGGGGSGATATAALDYETLYVHRLHVAIPGHGYTMDPTVRFYYEDLSVPVGLAATATRLTTGGELVRIDMTGGGTNYISPPPITLSYGNASAESVLRSTGKVIGVTMLTGGLYRTTPDVEFISNTGSGAVGTATLATLGSVVDLVLTTPGVYTVAPAVVITGTHTVLATGLYHTGAEEWPTLPGFHTDEVTGIVVNTWKKVVPARTPYPGKSGYRGPFIDMNVYDDWKSIQLRSEVDLSTLPPPEAWFSTYPFYLPPRLVSIEALWSDTIAKTASAVPDTTTSTGQVSVSIQTGSGGGVLITSLPAVRGRARCMVCRDYYYGQVPASMWAMLTPLKITGSSGSVVLVQRSTHAFGSKGNDIATVVGNRINTSNFAGSFDGGTIGDSYQQQVHSIDVDNYLVGTYSLIHPSHRSQGVQAVGQSGTNLLDLGNSAGLLSYMEVRLPVSVPTPQYLYSGRWILVEAEPKEWRLGIWVLERIYVEIP